MFLCLKNNKTKRKRLTYQTPKQHQQQNNLFLNHSPLINRQLPVIVLRQTAVNEAYCERGLLRKWCEHLWKSIIPGGICWLMMQFRQIARHEKCGPPTDDNPDMLHSACASIIVLIS